MTFVRAVAQVFGGVFSGNIATGTVEEDTGWSLDFSDSDDAAYLALF